MFTPLPQTRYDTPAPFGPSLLPNVSHYDDVQVLALSFVTQPEAVAPLIPRFYELAPEAVITVSQRTLKGVDYTKGRGYNILSVNVGVVYRGPHETVNGSHTLAVWENDTNAIIAGREFLGVPKLYGRIPDLIAHDGVWSFSCHEYDGLLVSGKASGMKPILGEKFEAIKKLASPMVALEWKYIPGPGGVADVDYPVKYSQGMDIQTMYSGRGEISWGEPTAQQSPISARIIERLRALPIIEYRPALLTRGPSFLHRAETRRLPWN